MRQSTKTRREALATFGRMGAAGLLSSAAPWTAKAFAEGAKPLPFHLAVINDEITQDFERACEIVAHDFGLQWIELRGMWNKNITDLSPAQIEESKKILAKYKLRVSDIGSPLFKTDLPNAPRSSQSESRDQFHANFDANAQDKLLDHCIVLAKAFGTNRIRCFDYWRLDDRKAFQATIHGKLREAAERCEKHGLILLLENEMSCNTATGAESAEVLEAIPNKNFMLNWDPGNAAAVGEAPYSAGYHLLPKHRIGHCHAKDVIQQAGKKYQWAAVGTGVVDWPGQLTALIHDGFRHTLSLETHWRGAGTPEASTRASFKGLQEALAKAQGGTAA